jgi:hypothetical protein
MLEISFNVEYRWKNYTTVYGKINIFVNAAILLNTLPVSLHRHPLHLPLLRLTLYSSIFIPENEKHVSQRKSSLLFEILSHYTLSLSLCQNNIL